MNVPTPKKMRPFFATSIALTAVTAGVPAIAAQTQAGSERPSYGHTVAVPAATAVRLSGTILLDAKLDEDAWKNATPITDFRQIDPEEGKPASQRTEVRFLFDDEALYIGAKMYDTEGDKGVMTRLVRRDANFDSDYFEIVIDGYHDHLGRAFFDLNPSGAKDDYIGIGTSCCDSGWDPIWEAATHIDDDGWTAEIRIPFSQLRFSRDSVQTWGLQVRRFIKRRDEQDQWSWWGKTENGGPARFGHLEGLRIPASTTHLELLPYVVSKSSSVFTTPGDPFNKHGRPTFQAGLDLKDRLTSNLTLDATFNPDFGQVEVDPAVLNLSAFETFFPEKRPFFVEGGQVFDFGSLNCNFCSNTEGMTGFYSRRIGRAPEVASLAQNDFTYSYVPDATTILGAGKITGRTTSGMTVGVLDALTGRSDARVQSSAGDRGTQEVEPLSNYFVGRLKQDYHHGDVVVGGIFSGVARNIDTTFAPFLARHAEMYGNDVRVNWHEQMYTFQASAALTNVSGDSREILLRQQSSARYFQRPDRGTGSSGFFTNRLDSSATSLRGGGLFARLSKNTGNVFGELALTTRTPGFESNDYSFQTRADYATSFANVGLTLTKPTKWYRQIVMLGGGQAGRNYEGDWTQGQQQLYFSETTPQFWNVTVFGLHRPSVIDDRQLRGGPAVGTATGEYVEADVSTDTRHAVTLSGGYNYYWDAKGTSATGASMSVGYRPVSNVSVSVGPSWNPSRNYAQYVTAQADPTATGFYGTRYVVSNLDERTLGLDTRVSVTFNPRMTLELYAQPFFAAGRYYNFKEYVRPRSVATAVYGRDRGTIAANLDTTGATVSYTIDPDGAGPANAFTVGNPSFTEQSLRGNAVFRWEYHPGSVLYLAWTQSRVGNAAYGDLQFGRDRSALFEARPDNIFLVKVSWWLPR